MKCAGKICTPRLTSACVDGECKCGMSPECDPKSLERHCLLYDMTTPMANDTTAMCKKGMTLYSFGIRQINYLDSN